MAVAPPENLIKRSFLAEALTREPFLQVLGIGGKMIS
jgi:hypothetical protein